MAEQEFVDVDIDVEDQRCALSSPSKGRDSSESVTGEMILFLQVFVVASMVVIAVAMGINEVVFNQQLSFAASASQALTAA
jgi:hypothetical protein